MKTKKQFIEPTAVRPYSPPLAELYLLDCEAGFQISGVETDYMIDEYETW